MRRYLRTAVVMAAVVLTSIPATCARYAYVTAARNSLGAQNAGFTMNGLTPTSSRFSGPQSGWASSGSGPYIGPGISGFGYTYTGNYSFFMTDVGDSWGEWAFSVPDEADKSGYYDVYYGVRFTVSAAQDVPPIWTISNASGVNFVNSTLTAVQTSNVWVKVATQLQFNRGQTYTIKCANRDTGIAGKRMNLDMVAFVFVKTNSPQNLSALPAPGGLSVDLAWNAPDPAPASYIIQRKEGAAGAWQTIATGVTSSSYSDPMPLCGTTWYYQVKAMDAAGVVSGASNEAFCLRCDSAGQNVPRIAGLSSLADGTYILENKTVTGAVGGAFWVEEYDRSAAIKCIGTATQGQKYAQITGTLATVDGQRVLTNAAATGPSTGDDIEPLIINARAAGGQSTTGHPSVTNGVGVYNLGMLVKLAGQAEEVTDNWFYLNDGSGARVKVLKDASVTVPGYVQATGLLGVQDGEPMLTMRGPDDLVPASP